MSEKFRGITPDNSSALPQRDNLLPTPELEFDYAIDIASRITNLGTRNDLYLTIASEQARAGMNPLFPPEYFLGLVDQSIPINAESPVERIALMQAQLGDSTGALETAYRTSKFPWFWGELARTLAPQGVDVQPIFAEMASKVKSSDFSSLHTAGMIVETQRELELPPDKLLVDQFKGYTSPYQDAIDTHNIMLTTAYAQGGFPEEALDAWTSISENYYLPNRVKTLAVVAVAQAREGVDASEVIAKVQELTGLIEPTEPVFDVPGAEKAEIYADLARASFLSGDDPQPMFNTALRHALEETSNLRTNAYIEIAKAQLDVGIDARNTLTLARDWASGIVKPDEPDGSWGSAIQIIDWEYVFRAQLEGQYFDEARETLKLFERYPEEEVAAYTAGLLAALGRAQMLSIYNTHV